MKNYSSILSFFLLIFLFSCQNQPAESNAKFVLANGVYLVLDELHDASQKPEKGLVVEYSHDFLDPNEKGEPAAFVLDTTDFVPLNLAKEPEGIEQPDKRLNLHLTLTDEASEKLTAFTGAHVKHKVAIVIGGKAVTRHMIREKIVGGKLQISRCTDDACRLLLLDLKQNSVQ